MANQEKSDLTLKVMVLGESSVGKTCFINRYTNNEFENNYISTIGIDFQNKPIEIEGKKVTLQIWDTAGQECFRTFTKNYLRKSHGFILAYSITNRRSFEYINDWIKQIKEFREECIDIIIIGTKCDLQNERIVSIEEGVLLGKQHSIKVIETSAKDNINVDEVFKFISSQILYSIENGDIPQRPSIVLEKNGKEKTDKKKCC